MMPSISYKYDSLHETNNSDNISFEMSVFLVNFTTFIPVSDKMLSCLEGFRVG